MWLGVDIGKEHLDYCLVDYNLKIVKNKKVKWSKLEKELSILFKNYKIDGITIEWTGYLTLKFYKIANKFTKEIYVVNGKYTKQERTKYRFQLKTDTFDSFILAKSFQDKLILKKLDKIEEFEYIKELVTQYNFLVETIVGFKHIKNEIDNFKLGDLLEYLEKTKNLLKSKLKAVILNSKYKELIEIPGVSFITAAYLVSYVGNINRFDNLKAFLSYIGAVKKSEESGKRKYRKKNFFFHRKLYNVLWMATLGAIRLKGDNIIKKEFYKQIEKGKNHVTARKHALRKLGELIYKKLRDIENRS